MTRGQASLLLGTWFGVMPRGVESQLFLGTEVPVRKQLAAFAYSGLHRHSDGDLDLRDANVGLSWLPVWTPTAMVRIRPGLSVPIGGLSSSFLFTPLSTSSLDPWLGADWLVGGTWVVGGSAIARVPLYEGWDRIKQGPFLRLDGRVSRRSGSFVPWLGLSAVQQAASQPRGASPDFAELAVTAGSVIAIRERWSTTVQARIPLMVSLGASRIFSGGVAFRYVVGKREDKEAP